MCDSGKPALRRLGREAGAKASPLVEFPDVLENTRNEPTKALPAASFRDGGAGVVMQPVRLVKLMQSTRH
jgi:hypothetical protein